MTQGEIVIICLLVICLGMLVAVLLKKQNNNNSLGDAKRIIENNRDIILEKLSLDKVKLIMQESFSNMNYDVIKNLNNNKVELIELLNKNIKNITEEFNRINVNITKVLSDTQNKMSEKLEEKIKEISNNFTNFSDRVIKFLQEEINKLNEQVKGQLDEGFKRTNESFTQMLESITKITEAQKQIEKVQDNVVSLQNVLSNQKQRGIFGEVQLSTILYNVFGEIEGNNVYELQHKFAENGLIADAIIKCPPPIGTISVDSKFPLENYLKMLNSTDEAKKSFSTLFKIDVKKKIKEIAEKYIIDNVTSDQAIMFIPSEAIFAEINANHYDLVEESQKNKVWLTSPTTLIAFLTTVATLLQNISQSKNVLVIKENITILAAEFERYKKRWGDLEKHIDLVSNDVKNISNTSKKISNRFEQITKVPDNKLLHEQSKEDEVVACLK